jgi:hypothetical protein
MSLRLVLFCWICLGVFVSGCGTASQEDKKDSPKAQVIGHGTQRSGWLGVGVTIPLPGQSDQRPTLQRIGLRGCTIRQQAVMLTPCSSSSGRSAGRGSQWLALLPPHGAQ